LSLLSSHGLTGTLALVQLTPQPVDLVFESGYLRCPGRSQGGSSVLDGL
jgi:hypothetical protein